MAHAFSNMCVSRISFFFSINISFYDEINLVELIWYTWPRNHVNVVLLDMTEYDEVFSQD